jgi:hypothetical protein
LRVHGEYIKVAQSRVKDVGVKFDDSALKSIGNKIVMKIEDSFGGVKILRESMMRSL